MNLIKIGTRYVNMDHVEVIEVNSDRFALNQLPAEGPEVTLWTDYPNGMGLTLSGADAFAVLQWLKNVSVDVASAYEGLPYVPQS